MTSRIIVRQAALVVSTAVGIHARPAAVLVTLAQRFDAHITLECNQHLANARSILDILLLGATRGSEITVTATGTDADAALLAIAGLFSCGFEETMQNGVTVRADANVRTGGTNRPPYGSHRAAVLTAAAV